MRIPRLILPLVSVVLAAGCGTDSGVSANRSEQRVGGDATSSTDEVTPTTDAGPAPTIDWQPVEGFDDVDEGRLEVPIDYENPDGGTFELYVVRNQANDPDERIGTLLVNPGGPGFPGSDWALNADGNYGEDLLDHFDIVGWDPRGSGQSEPRIDCVDDYDRYFGGPDITPDDDAERQELIDLAKEFEDACVERSGEIIPFVGTNNSARDIDRLRRALGEETITYFGFSYGSELGAVWATMFPDTVRAAVLDGAVDPTLGFYEVTLQQYTAFERTLGTFLAECSANRACAFHNDGNAEEAFDALMADLDENPIPTEPGRPDANRAVGVGATISAMYSTVYWGQLEEALDAAQDGEGAGLLTLFDDYYQRRFDGTWGNELEAFQVISCVDWGERPTIEKEDAFASELTAVAPRLSPDGATGSYTCTFLPPSSDPRAEITGAGAPDLLVVGTTGDPATPLEGSREMARQLENGALLVVDADEHTGYHVNECSRDTIESYLVDLEVPADESEC